MSSPEPTPITNSNNNSLPSVVPSNYSPLLQKAYEEQTKSGQVSLAQMEQASKGITKLVGGYHAAIPMYCHGAQCPMALKCPLWGAGFTYMVGQACPLEAHLMDDWINSIVKELRVNRDNHTEMGLVIELAKIDIYNWRISNKLSFEDHIKQQVVGISDDGEAMYRDELHISADWDDMLAKRRLKYMDALLATRKSVAGVGGGMAQDPSSQAAAIRTLLEKKRKEQADISEGLIAEGAKPAKKA